MSDINYIELYKKNIDKILDKEYYLLTKTIRSCELNGTVVYKCKLEFNKLYICSDTCTSKDASYNDALRKFFIIFNKANS